RASVPRLLVLARRAVCGERAARRCDRAHGPGVRTRQRRRDALGGVRRGAASPCREHAAGALPPRARAGGRLARGQRLPPAATHLGAPEAELIVLAKGRLLAGQTAQQVAERASLAEERIRVERVDDRTRLA